MHRGHTHTDIVTHTFHQTRRRRPQAGLFCIFMCDNVKTCQLTRTAYRRYALCLRTMGQRRLQHLFHMVLKTIIGTQRDEINIELKFALY